MHTQKQTFKRANSARIIISGFACLFVLTACATKPDPAVVCTSEWIKPRAASAVKEIKSETGRTLKSLKKNVKTIQSGGALSGFAKMRMLSSVQRLATKLERGSGMKDLKTLASTCDDPDIIKSALTGYLQDMKAPQALTDLINEFDYEAMVAQMKDSQAAE